MKTRQLGKVKQILEEGFGLDITHFWDDLAFVESSPFIVQFDSDPQYLKIYFSRDCEEKNRAGIMARFRSAASANGMRCGESGSFSLEQIEGAEELSVRFYEPRR